MVAEVHGAELWGRFEDQFFTENAKDLVDPSEVFDDKTRLHP